MKISEVLDRAADYLNTNGWCQNSLFRPGGGACARGAIMIVTGAAYGIGKRGIPEKIVDQGTPECTAFMQAEKFLQERMLNHCWPIPTWNDQPRRTKMGVIATLRAAAKLARDAEAETETQALIQRVQEGTCVKSVCEQPITSLVTVKTGAVTMSVAPAVYSEWVKQKDKWLAGSWDDSPTLPTPTTPSSEPNTPKPCVTTSACLKLPLSSASVSGLHLTT